MTQIEKYIWLIGKLQTFNAGLTLQEISNAWEQRRSSVAGLTEYPTDSVHEEWQVGDTVQLRTEPFEL